MSESESLPVIMRSHAELAIKLYESGGELTPEIQVALDLVTEKTVQKVDAYGHIMDRLEVESAFLSEKIKQLQDLQGKIEKARDGLEFLMTQALNTTDDKTLQGNEYKFKLSPTAGRTIVDETLLPIAYCKFEVLKTIDRARIKSELKDGRQVPGCSIEPGWSFRKTIGSKLLKG